MESSQMRLNFVKLQTLIKKLTTEAQGSQREHEK